jgi:hypothetical protein
MTVGSSSSIAKTPGGSSSSETPVGTSGWIVNLEGGTDWGGTYSQVDIAVACAGTRRVINVDPCDVVATDGEWVGPHQSLDVTESTPSEVEDNSWTMPQSDRNNPGRMRTEEVEVTSIPMAMPLPDPESVATQPLARPPTSRTRRRSEDAQDEMRLFGFCGSREHPRSCRDSGRNSHTFDSNSRDSRASVTGGARADSLAEDPSACWVALRYSSSAPGGSELGAAPARPLRLMRGSSPRGAPPGG